MTRKGDFVLRQIADEYVLIPYGATAEKMNQVRLGKAYDMPAEEVQEDVNAVLETFRNYGILERV